jgi:hypothetical protein
MKVLLVSANTERVNMVTLPLGLGLVRAAARSAGHEVAFLDLLSERLFLLLDVACPGAERPLSFAATDGRDDRTAGAGIRVMSFLLLGGPGETCASVEESLTFARSLSLADLRITVGTRIYPGTPLATRAVTEGVIASEEDLLRPRFYLAPGFEPWIQTRVAGFSLVP